MNANTAIEDKFGLRPLWDALLEVYNEFAKICDRYGLRYYVTDGAALGAIRHNGFIPWDDDLDISMPREDYEKFKEVADKELPSYLKFVDWKNTPEFTLLFGKIQDSREAHVKAVENKLGRMLSNGIYIDLFPIDGYPKAGLSVVWMKIRDAFLLVVERFYLYKFSRLSRKGKTAWLLGMVCSCFVPWLRTQRQFLSFHDKNVRMVPFAKSTLVGRTCQRMNLFRRTPVPKEIWGRPTPYDFEGQKVMVPSDLKAHLINEYGEDYLTPPPESYRHPGHSYSWRCPWWLGPTGKNG